MRSYRNWWVLGLALLALCISAVGVTAQDDKLVYLFGSSGFRVGR